MFDVGGGELLLILLAVIVLFGPKKLPEIAQMFGKGMSHLRKAQNEIQSQFNEIKSEVNTQVRSVADSVREVPQNINSTFVEEKVQAQTLDENKNTNKD